MELDNLVENIVSSELNNGVRKFISKIDNVAFRYNSFNICIGPQGSSKTTSVMKELMKLSTVDNDYHLIIYVSNNSSDDTVNNLLPYLNIPVVKTDYEHIDNQFSELIALKDEYNKMINNEIPRDSEILEALNLTEFKPRRLHTFILFDDASFIFDQRSKSKFLSWLCQCRHLNITVFCCIQIWTSLSAQLKSQLSSVYLFKGFSRERVAYIYRQVSVDMNFNDFYNMYLKLGKYKKMIIDNVDSSVRIG